MILAIVVASVLHAPGDVPPVRDVHISAAAERSLGFVRPVDVDTRRAIVESMRECNEEVECVERILRSAQIDVVVHIVANFEVDPPILSTEVQDVSSGDIIVSDVTETRRDVTIVKAAVDETVVHVFSSAGYEIGGQLFVDVEPKDATVTIDTTGFRMLLSPRRFSVPVGTVGIRAERDGYEAATRKVHVEPGATESVHLDLTPLPSESLLASPWFWVGVGAVVLVTGGVVLAVQADRPATFCVSNDVERCQ